MILPRVPKLTPQIQRSLGIVTSACAILGGIAGALAIFSEISPSWFYQRGEEHMAWSIDLSITGASITVIGWLTAFFSGAKKWKWVGWNFLFIISWVLAEVIRVACYPR